jgi:hypothetical protein
MMTSSFDRLSHYFLDLGFFPGQVELGPGRLQLLRLAWSLSAYGLLVSGLLAQQCVDLTKRPIQFSVANLHWPVFAASAIAGLALFKPFMFWFNKKRHQPSWEHVLWAFSFGFFVNLSTNVIWKMVVK